MVFQGGFEITLSHSPKNWEESFDPDPFLVLSYAREPFYLDVWDERDFEKEN